MSAIASKNLETSSEEAARLLREIAGVTNPPGTIRKELICSLSKRFGWTFSRCKTMWHREARIRPEELDALRAARGEIRRANPKEANLDRSDFQADLAAIRGELERINLFLELLARKETDLAPMARVAISTAQVPRLQGGAQARATGPRTPEALA